MTATMSKKDQKDHEKAEKRRRQKLRRESRKRDLALSELYPKPVEDWDNEELARGRPRASDGTFSGRPPSFVSREIHEEAVRRFTTIATDDMRALVPEAIATVERIILSKAVDDKGKPTIPPAVQLAAAQWVVEHLVGKPKQRLEADISVKLQGILANVMVSPDELSGGYMPAIEAQSWEQDDDTDLVGESTE